jgi:MraZ protein
MLDGGNPEMEIATFSGTEEVSIDDKGRLLVSKKKRERLGNDFVFFLSEIGVVAAYPKETWRTMVNEVNKVSILNTGRQQFSRLMAYHAVEDMNFDAQGRVVIPGRLRAEGKLVDRVMIAGAIEKVEFWAMKEWRKYNEDTTGYGKERREAITSAVRMMREQ